MSVRAEGRHLIRTFHAACVCIDMWKKISFVAVLVLLACAASSAALLRGNDVTVVQHVPTQTVVSAEASTGGAASPCGCCGVATCSCCKKNRRSNAPRSFRALTPQWRRHPAVRATALAHARRRHQRLPLLPPRPG